MAVDRAIAVGRRDAFSVRTCDAGLRTLGSAGTDSPANLNGSSIFQGVLNTGSADLAFSPLSLAYLPTQQRFDPLAANSLFANQNYLNVGFRCRFYLSPCQ
jgi:hypothetical protein